MINDFRPILKLFRNNFRCSHLLIVRSIEKLQDDSDNWGGKLKVFKDKLKENGSNMMDEIKRQISAQNKKNE